METVDFSPYDSIFYCASIAHNSSDSKLEDLYYQVNRDLTIAVATKAKAQGVKQFIFMSSMIVFGNHPSGKTYITADTKANPDNFYGDSKLQNAEFVQTSEMVRLIAENYEYKNFKPTTFNVIIDKMFRLNIIKKVVGHLYYNQNISQYKDRDYQKYDLKQSIDKTEGLR